MPNDQRLNELESDIAQLKVFSEQFRELLNAIDLRLVEVRDELRKDRLSRMHDRDVAQEG